MRVAGMAPRSQGDPSSGPATSCRDAASSHGSPESIPGQRVELPVPRAIDPSSASSLLTRDIEALAGVSRAVFNPVTNQLVVVFDPAVSGVEEVVAAATLRASRDLPVRWHLALTDLRCQRCARRLERAVDSVPGVRAAIANTATQSLTVEYAPVGTDVERLRRTIADEGFALIASRSACDDTHTPRAAARSHGGT